MATDIRSGALSCTSLTDNEREILQMPLASFYSKAQECLVRGVEEIPADVLNAVSQAESSSRGILNSIQNQITSFDADERVVVCTLVALSLLDHAKESYVPASEIEFVEG